MCVVQEYDLLVAAKKELEMEERKPTDSYICYILLCSSESLLEKGRAIQNAYLL